MATITVYKLNHLGQMQFQYEGEEVDRGETWLCIDARFGRSDRDLGYVVFRQGDYMREWFFSDRWYNIFRIEDVHDRQLKGWYCNITRPAHFESTTVRADDLALDVFVYPDSRTLLLDEDEFAALDLDVADRACALDAVSQLRAQVAARIYPFDEIDPATLYQGE